ncbi:hypothetical protein PHMEG_00014059 [Phytophthora megakarya]|uniref:CCHC-type domain-containing protein n=1 Tax=Phytophthora megakarya TaxID=4795 RepID=A0A225W586_9STRA|nr:hypothetical protein PHMEG_00014059 [Phytophthora megakarya]
MADAAEDSPEQDEVAEADGVKTRKGYNCGEVGHLAKHCPGKDDSAKESKISLAVGTGTSEDKHTWILDSGFSVNLVKNVNLLKTAKDCDGQT